MQIAKFDIGMGRGEAEVVRVNDSTVVVKMRRGGKSKEIKRHIEKHCVEFVGEE
jgi:hypothetical protein